MSFIQEKTMGDRGWGAVPPHSGEVIPKGCGVRAGCTECWKGPRGNWARDWLGGGAGPCSGQLSRWRCPQGCDGWVSSPDGGLRYLRPDFGRGLRRRWAPGAAPTLWVLIYKRSSSEVS